MKPIDDATVERWAKELYFAAFPESNWKHAGDGFSPKYRRKAAVELRIRVLGLDPATKSGWAWTDGDTRMHGTFSIDIAGTEHAGNKLIRFRDWLREVIDRFGCDRIGFEDASFGAFNQNTKAFHNQLRGIILMVAAERGIPFSAYQPSKIKKFATDCGAAKKDQMIRAAQREFGIVEIADDNQADALFVMLLTLQEAQGRRFETAPTPRQKPKGRRPPRAKERKLF